MTRTGRGHGLDWRASVEATLAEAIGRRHRHDPDLPRTGGPAGNARLTAWIGLTLLVLSLAELVTLLDVEQWISWHIVIGALLVPPALAKTASTGWRVLRYYGGDSAYRAAGPPPMPLRVLGPLVVASTLGLLASGIVLIALGPKGSRAVLLDVVGQRVDWVTVHQGFFLVWAVVTGLHVLARMVPAVGLTVRRAAGPRVDGRMPRAGLLLATAGLAALTAVLLLAAAPSWRSGGGDHFGDHRLESGH